MTERLDQHKRLLIAAAFGVVVGMATAFFCPWQLTVLAAWDVAALCFVGSVWTFIPVLDARATQDLATREDDSRKVVDLVIVVACLMSLGGVVAGLAEARRHSGVEYAILGTLAVFTVFLSWFTVNTLYALRYAHLYYGDSPGGIDFPAPNDGPKHGPDYLDFVYLAFTIGMTFQVSDTVITDPSIRRTVIRHGLLSYAFGTAIVGVTINAVGAIIS